MKLAALPEGLPPADLPPARAEQQAGRRRPAKAGVVSLTRARVQERGLGLRARGLLRRRRPAGWSSGCTARPWPSRRSCSAQWKPLCDRYGLLLVVPKAAAESGWRADEAGYLEKLVRQVQASYTMDPTRVVVGGRGPGGTLAYMAAFRSRDLFRAVAAVDAGSMLPPPESEPEHRLAIYLATAKKSPQAAAIAHAAVAFRDAKLPVTEGPRDDPRDLTPRRAGRVGPLDRHARPDLSDLPVLYDVGGSARAGRPQTYTPQKAATCGVSEGSLCG